MKLNEKQEQIIQFIKFCLVGVLNTLVTLAVIYLCKSFFGINDYISNACGYICGMINSFLCNRRFVFESQGSYAREASRFLAGFLVCYLLQLTTVWLINRTDFGNLLFYVYGIAVTGYGIATLIGNIVYTIANFIFNRLITFKK